MIDFDPISAAAAREAIDKGIYGTRDHARLETGMRTGNHHDDRSYPCRYLPDNGHSIRCQCAVGSQSEETP